jgi:hypothetical protein
MTAPLRQESLGWPGTGETCPKCHGKCHVYYLHTGQSGVEFVGGKRVTCPVCAGAGTVRTPLRSETESAGWGHSTRGNGGWRRLSPAIRFGL